jgi:hypothetical protein
LSSTVGFSVPLILFWVTGLDYADKCCLISGWILLDASEFRGARFRFRGVWQLALGIVNGPSFLIIFFSEFRGAPLQISYVQYDGVDSEYLF